jgi:hypothetical protein
VLHGWFEVGIWGKYMPGHEVVVPFHFWCGLSQEYKFNTV